MSEFLLDLRIRIEHVERNTLIGGFHNAHMLAPQFPRVPAAARVRDHVDLLIHVGHVVGNTLKLLLHDQATLQSLVVRRYPGRAGIGVAAQCLDAAKGEHETARSVGEIRAGTQHRDEMPFNRATKGWVYRLPKDEGGIIGFGSTFDLREPGSIIFVNAPFPVLEEDRLPTPPLMI